VAGQLILNKRSFESMVLVEDGNYVVLSGLIEDRTNVSVQKVPLLGDIPFLGALFRYENRDRNRTNTMVFLRPIIVRDESTSSAMAAERYEYMRTQMVDARAPDSLIFRDLNVTPIPRSPDPRLQPPPPTPAGTTPAVPAPPPGATVQPSAPSPTGVAPVGPTAAAPATAQGVQVLQVTVMPDLASGRRIQQELRSAGFDAYLEPVRTSTGEIFRVRVAVDTAQRSLAEAAAELRRLGYQPIPIQR
jgi:general secretion pathway protein D